MVSSKSKNSGNRYKELTSPMSGYQGQLNGARFAKKCDTEILPRQFAGVGISCLNNGLLKHWLDFQNSCLLDILETSW